VIRGGGWLATWSWSTFGHSTLSSGLTWGFVVVVGLTGAALGGALVVVARGGFGTGSLPDRLRHRRGFNLTRFLSASAVSSVFLVVFTAASGGRPPHVMTLDCGYPAARRR